MSSVGTSRLGTEYHRQVGKSHTWFGLFMVIACKNRIHQPYPLKGSTWIRHLNLPSSCFKGSFKYRQQRQPSFVWIWRPLCSLWSETILFPFHICQNWSAVSNSRPAFKCFPSSFYWRSHATTIASPTVQGHSGLSHTHVAAMVTAVNSPVLPAVPSRELTVTSEKMLLLKISFIWTVWCRAVAAASSWRVNDDRSAAAVLIGPLYCCKNVS